MTDNIFLLTGSNLGNRLSNLKTALDKTGQIESVVIVDQSSIYESEAVGMAEETPAFLNQAIKIKYANSASQLLADLEKTEKEMGRLDKGKNQSRIIDIDILLFGDQQIDLTDLTIPHKELLNRPFALKPLLEISPALIHPINKELINDYLTVDDAASILLYNTHVSGKIRS